MTQFLPQNEMGVVALFLTVAADHGWSLVSIGASFPDAEVELNGKRYLAEFEYAASNFTKHGHDPRKCDLIICWENDFHESYLPILSIKNSEDFIMKEASEFEKEVMFLRAENRRLKREISSLRINAAAVERIEKSKKKKRSVWADGATPPPGDGWRLETTNGGKYCQWRRSVNGKRESAYGGKVSNPPSRAGG